MSDNSGDKSLGDSEIINHIWKYYGLYTGVHFEPLKVPRQCNVLQGFLVFKGCLANCFFGEVLSVRCLDFLSQRSIFFILPR